jgi:pSer/pThr/pTyr-binding forkhead associated (FHA) protein
MPQLVLRFISGKDYGREIPLPLGREIIVGRISEADLLMLDDQVSRKHAKISTHGDQILIQDLESRNGTFVNGARVRSAALAEGDEILIGSSRIKLVAVDAAGLSAAAAEATQLLNLPQSQPQAAPEPATPAPEPSMAGSIAEFTLPDLLQLLTNSKKSGVLTLRSERGLGRMHLRDGQIYYASLDDNFALPPRKAFYRILGWTTGTFELGPPGNHLVTEEITETTMALLLEGLKHLDEIKQLETKLPPATAQLVVPMKLPGHLRDLATEELQMFQLVLHHGTLREVVNHFPGADLEAYTCVLGLLRRGFIEVS